MLGSISDVLQPGTNLVAAGYCMYGAATQMVLSFGAGVSVFTLDPSIGEFILTVAKVTIPAKPKTIYSCNEGNWASFDDATKEFITQCKEKKPKPCVGGALAWSLCACLRCIGAAGTLCAT